MLHRSLILGLATFAILSTSCADFLNKKEQPKTPPPPVPVETISPWMELCLNREALPEAQRATVKALLAAVGTCQDVDVYTKPNNAHKLEINFFGERIPEVDLTPIAQLDELKLLSISGDSIKDLRPLAGMKQLQYLEIHGSVVAEAFCPQDSASDGVNNACKQMLRPCDPDRFTPYFLFSKEERSRMPQDMNIRDAPWLFSHGPNDTAFLNLELLKPQTICRNGVHVSQGQGTLLIDDVLIHSPLAHPRVYKLGEKVVGTDGICLVDGKEVCRIFLEKADSDDFAVIIKDLDGTELLRKTSRPRMVSETYEFLRVPQSLPVYRD